MPSMSLKPKFEQAVLLRTPTLIDTALVVQWAQSPELAEYFRRYAPIMDWRNPEQILQGLSWSYVICEGEQVVGLIQLTNMDASAKSVDIGLMVDSTLTPNRWRASQQAYEQICNYLFNHVQLHKVYMKTLTSRTKLRSRLEKAGWQVEAELRESCKFQDEYKNEWLLGLLKKDFKSKQGSK